MKHNTYKTYRVKIKHGYQKGIAVLLICIVWFTPMLTPLGFVYAEDTPEIQQPAEQPTQTYIDDTIQPPVTTQTDEPQIESSPDPTPMPNGEAIIDTGASTAEALSTIDANTTTTTVPGIIETEGCSVDGSIGCSIEVSDEVTLAETITSDALTGSNDIRDIYSPASIETGTASATAISDNQLNTTDISIQDTQYDPENTGDPHTIDISHTAETTLTESSEAISGSNQTNSTANSSIVTSDSYASSSMVNVINTTTVGSTLKFLTMSLTSPTDTPINLRDIWDEMVTHNTSAETAMIMTSDGALLRISDSAILNATVLATSISGHNEQSDVAGAATISTGDSYASANLINIINSQFIGSQYLIAVINIFDAMNADIIIPSLLHFLQDQQNQIQPETVTGQPLTISQTANIGPGEVTAQSQTGDNHTAQTPTAAIQTGQALSFGTNTTLVNSQFTATDWWYQILVNSFGNWNGALTGWDEQSKDTLLPFGSTVLQASGNSNAYPTEPEQQPNEQPDIMASAWVRYLVGARAVSGENSIQNAATAAIKTGNATALANVFNMINTTAIGHRFIFPVINIFGSWNGNLVVAHPDLQLSMESDSHTLPVGGKTTMQVSYANSGHEDARSSSIEITLPQGFSYIPESASQPIYVSGNNLIFPLGTIAPGAQGSLSFRIQCDDIIDGSISFGQTLKHLLIPSAFASTQSVDISVSAGIATTDPESDTANNWATTTIAITKEYSNSTSASDSSDPHTTQPVPNALPILSADIRHNVNEFVYPGDTATFFLTVKNIGNEAAQTSELTLTLFNPSNIHVLSIPFSVGNLDPGVAMNITFGLTIPKTALGGTYTAYVYGSGSSQNGTRVTSPTVSRSFFVKNIMLTSPEIVTIPTIQKTIPGTVLAAETENSCSESKSSWTWMLLLLALILWFIDHTQLRKNQRELEKSIEATQRDFRPPTTPTQFEKVSGG